MKKVLFLFCFVLTILLIGCQKKVATKASHHHKKIIQSEKSIKLSEEDVFDFSQMDTLNYYLGEIDDSTYIFKIDHVNKNALIGHYYAVNSQPVAENHRFEILYRDKEYLFCTHNKDIPLHFDIHLDTASIFGSFTTEDVSFKKHDLAFEVLQEPEYHEPTSSRYMTTSTEELPIEIDHDVVYGEAKGYWSSKPINDEKYAKVFLKGLTKTLREKNVELAMDIYHPKDDCQKRPLFVLLHGGAFYLGDKGDETMSTWCKNFAQRGYVVASINYRMGFNISKPSIQKCGYAAIQDAHAALRYLVAHAKQYRIDPDYIFIGGTSAGSITALGVTFMTNATRPSFVFAHHLDKKMGNLEASSNQYKGSFKIRAIANMWGAVYDLDELHGHQTAVISFHGTNDNIVPFDEGFPFSHIKGNVGELLFDKMYGSNAMHQRLDSLRVRNEFHPLEGAQHAPYQDKSGHPNSTYYYIQDHILDFFYYELGKTGTIQRDNNNPQGYNFPQKDLLQIFWKAEGGFILKQDKNSVQVLWRKDAPKKSLTVAGTRENFTCFKKTANF